MLSLEEAQARVFAAITPMGSEVVPLVSGARRIAAEDAVAGIDLPRFDNSAMDGFAVRSEDVRSASEANPIRLRVNDTVAAGQQSSAIVTPLAAIRVFTGSPMPAGADAVVMQEDTRSAGQFVEVLDSVKPWEHVRFRGEDLKRGETIVRRGEVLTVGRISALAATGSAEIRVGKRPVVALLSTGDELCEPGTPLAPGQIYESNRVMLANLIADAGGIAIPFPLVPDTLAATRAALEKGLSEADAVITTGGVSVGERDFVKAAFEEIGGVQDFWRVAIRPGKPFVFGKWREKFLFGLPGNPVSAFVTFLLLVRPALRQWQGATETGLRRRQAVLGDAIVNSGDRRHFVRVTVDADGVACLAGVQASHTLGSLARSNGLLDLAPHASLRSGEKVDVLHWQAA